MSDETKVLAERDFFMLEATQAKAKERQFERIIAQNARRIIELERQILSFKLEDLNRKLDQATSEMQSKVVVELSAQHAIEACKKDLTQKYQCKTDTWGYNADTLEIID